MFRVAQCWDDGVVSDIALVEMFRKYGARATFNLNPGFFRPQMRRYSWTHDGFDVYNLAQSELRSVYDGFQVSSHTMTHADYRRMSTDAFVREAVDARKYLEDLFQRESRGFAWPCGRYTQELADRLLESGFLYGRTTENRLQLLPVEHPLILHSSCHFLNENFMEIFERSREFGVFYFWGHSYEMHDEPSKLAALEKKIATISADPDVVWVDVVDLVREDGSASDVGKEG